MDCVSCDCAAGHILQQPAGSLLDPISRHPQYPGALPIWDLPQKQPMKFLLHYLIDEGNSLLPVPLSLKVCVDHVVAWSTQAFPITVCHFCLAGFCSEAKENHVEHLRMYVMVSVLFLIPQ